MTWITSENSMIAMPTGGASSSTAQDERRSSDEAEAPPVGLAVHDASRPIGILSPGNHLVEVAFAHEVSRDAIVRGLKRIGFDRVIVDEGAHASIALKGSEPVQILATCSHALRLIDTESVSWIDTQTIDSDPFTELRYQLIPFPLVQGRTYEILFITRMKAHPTKDRVAEVLRAMRGFETEKLLTLRKDMRIPGHPGTSAALWFGIARWFGPHSHVNMDDPVCFEEIREGSAVRSSEEC